MELLDIVDENNNLTGKTEERSIVHEKGTFIAYTDNNFSDSEGHFICSIGDALQIEAQKIGEISSWIIDHIIWLEQEALIFEEINHKGE